MERLFRFPNRDLGFVLLGVIAWLPSSAVSEVTFTLDPARSSIALSGSVIGVALTEQGPGSLTSQFEGTLVTDLTGTSIAFLGSSSIQARNSGDWQPLAAGEPGSAPANFGGKVTTFLANAVAAARKILFSATSAPIPLAGDGFDASGIVFGFPTNSTSVLDYSASGLLSQKGQLSLTGLSTNQITGRATLLTVGDVQTLTLPVTNTYEFTLLLPGDVRLTLSGQLVGTRSMGGGGATLEDFLAAEFPGVTDPAIVGPEADPDGDGLPNFVEFAFGLEPSAADAGFAPLDTRPGPAGPSERIVEYVRPTGLSGVSYKLEWSTDLVTWNLLTTVPQITDLGNGQERVQVTDTEPVGPGGIRTIRLTVTRP